ncbi:hypothetical protein [Halalkalicoccus sp. NIPERK01]|uniref:DUF7836 family putative zinc-binding protein n=1 Tax=Halalkalicoccus sp. NIPERK01 TaxID=3053469 RepID=UPI00256F29F0|nr:hypothetical protein [Halalkalicoccus sp. NIPERK01]MDL5362360.1 hypothetical protein [Halalkalicoccus sp. NIPERK01]
MNETFVRLLCPECRKTWERKPGDLPAHTEAFACDGCGTERRTAEFTRTDRDLDVLKQFQ